MKKTGWFGFGFISIKLKKPNLTQTKKNQKKIEPNRKKTKPNRFEPVFVLKTKPKPVGLNRFRFFKKKIFQFGFFFL